VRAGLVVRAPDAMPRNSKPRRPYRRRVSLYPDLHDVGLIFRPIHTMFDQLREGEIDAVRGRPVFTDWMGEICEVVPALEGWISCWQRIIDGERLVFSLDGLRKISKRLDLGIMLTDDELEAGWREVLACQQATMQITRRAMGSYMRTEQISIELEQRGLVDAA
jgi:hypothetical protein